MRGGMGSGSGRKRLEKKNRPMEPKMKKSRGAARWVFGKKKNLIGCIGKGGSCDAGEQGRERGGAKWCIKKKE